jgi:type VI secretion system protein ImpA
MSAVDVEKLLQPVSVEDPCGDDLEYDPAFGELQRSAEGKPEQVMGSTVNPAEEPEWREVQRQAVAICARTKDLRVLILLLRALLANAGLPGLADGLHLLRGLLERYWDAIHPQLDPDDNLDPTMRVNIIASVCDPMTFLRGVHEAPLVSSRVMGRFSLRDIAVASGHMPAPPGSAAAAPTMSAIEAAFMDTDLEELQATAKAVDASMADVAAIENLVTAKVGVTNAPNLSELGAVFKEARQVLAEHLARRGVSAPGAEGEPAPTPAGAGAPPAAAALSGEITSREDVVRALDKISDYYNRHEPSSPIPMLVQRAKQLVSMDFLEILRNLAPDGVKQAELLRGPEAGKK